MACIPESAWQSIRTRRHISSCTCRTRPRSRVRCSNARRRSSLRGRTRRPRSCGCPRKPHVPG
eukprot:2290148-Rhodomonas_salina.2